MRRAFAGGPILDGAARSAVQACLRSKQLGGAGIQFRRAGKIRGPRRGGAELGKSAGTQAEDALEMKKLYRQTLENP